MPNATDAIHRPRRRTGLYLVALVVALGVLATQYVQRHMALAHSRTVDGMVDLLSEGGEEGWNARDELIARVGAGNIPFWSRLLDSPDAHTRCVAVDVLGDIKSPAVVPLLCHALSDSYSAARVTAIDSLPRIDPKAAVRPLLGGLTDHDSDVRRSAVIQLGRVRDKRAVPGLIRALRSPDRLTVQGAAFALRRITGEPFRMARVTSDTPIDADVRRWENWWTGARAGWPIDPALADVPPIEPSRISSAPRLRVQPLSGDPVDLSDLKGKVVVLSFWGTWCEQCIGEMPVLEAFTRAYGARGVRTIGLAVGESGAEPVRAFARTYGITFPLALASKAACNEWGHVHEVPVAFMLDRRGRIRYQWDGTRDDLTFAAAADRLLAEPP